MLVFEGPFQNLKGKGVSLYQKKKKKGGGAGRGELERKNSCWKFGLLPFPGNIFM